MRSLLAVLAALLLGAGAFAGGIPSLEDRHEYVHDYAELLDDETEEVVQVLAEESFHEDATPLVVVTIPRIRDYGESHIERLATRWFDEWGVGTLGLEGGSNKGILLLVARRDRKARIELGADWGRRWDAHCRKIMSGDLVPAFKAGDYPGGVRAGVQALREMARIGPDGSPPRDLLRDATEVTSDFSIFPQPIPLICLALGVAMIVLGVLRSSDASYYLIGGGVLLIMIGVLSYVTLLLFSLMNRTNSRGFSGSSGGGFSGGFSGGGGATGSW